MRVRTHLTPFTAQRKGTKNGLAVSDDNVGDWVC